MRFPFPVVPVAGFALLFLCMFYIFDLYDLQIFGQSTTLLSRLFCAGGVVLVVASAVSLFVSGPWHHWELPQGVAMALTVAFAWRRFFAANYALLLKQESTAVIGAGPRAECIRSLMDRPESRYRFTGFVHAGEGVPSGAGVLGSFAELPDLVERYGIRQLVLATDSVPALAEFQGVGFRGSPEIAMELSQSLPLELLSHSWLRLAEKSDLIERHVLRQVKRVCDLMLSVIALVFFGPLLALCAIAIRLESTGPVIFRQTRVGWHGKPFTIFKLRTMRHGSESRPQWAEVDDARVTRVGRFLRLTHIDANCPNCSM